MNVGKSLCSDFFQLEWLFFFGLFFVFFPAECTYRYGGFQFAHLYFQQGYLALKHLLGHIRESTITGNQILIALSQAQIFSGSGNPLLFEVGTKKDYVPENWTGTLQKFLHLCKAQICIPEAWHPSPQRQHDQILMDVIKHRLQSPNQSKRINRVRLYLRI